MIIEPKRIDPFEPAIDSTEFDAHHRDIAAQGYRHYANVADNREDSVVEAIEKAKRAGYHHVYAHGRAYDDKGVLIPGAVSIWVKRGCKDGCVA